MISKALRTCAILLTLSAGILPGFAQDAEPALDALDAEPDLEAIENLGKNSPADVAAFVDRVLECYHWAGEEPYDAARRREIRRAMRELRCGQVQIDKTASTLRAKYKGQAQILSVIDQARALY